MFPNKIKNQRKKMNEIVIKDKIVDFAGKEHWFIIAAVKQNLKTSSSNYSIVVSCNGNIGTGTNCVRTGLQIGISICNPIDKFDEKVGVLKAVARARATSPVLYTTYPGQLGDSIIQTYLAQEAKYIKENPDKFIKGYNEARANFLEHEEMEGIKQNFTDIEKVIVEGVKKDPTYLDNVQKYLSYLDRKCENQKK